jgi:hypothetical protein
LANQPPSLTRVRKDHPIASSPRKRGIKLRLRNTLSARLSAFFGKIPHTQWVSYPDRNHLERDEIRSDRRRSDLSCQFCRNRLQESSWDGGQSVMARPYSMDLRERAVRAVELEGLSRRAAAVRFGVAASTLITWVAHFRATGD